MFLSPLAWIILAVLQTILGYMFLTNLDNFFLLQPQLIQLANTPGVTDIVVTPLMQVAAIIMLMVMPLMTMPSSTTLGGCEVCRGCGWWMRRFFR